MRNQLVLRATLGILTALFGIVRLYYMRRGKESGEGISRGREDRLRLALITFCNSLGTIAGLVYVFAPQRIRLTALPMPVWSRWLGAALGIVDLLLFGWTHHALGRNWSARLLIKDQHTLVTNGPYRWVRHPMYTAIFGSWLAFFLISANWIIGIAGLGMSIVVASRVDKEEALMIEEFGDQYRAYMQRTGRFLPRIRAEARLRGTP